MVTTTKSRSFSFAYVSPDTLETVKEIIFPQGTIARTGFLTYKMVESYFSKPLSAFSVCGCLQLFTTRNVPGSRANRPL